MSTEYEHMEARILLYSSWYLQGLVQSWYPIGIYLNNRMNNFKKLRNFLGNSFFLL